MKEAYRLSENFGVGNIDCVRVARDAGYRFSYRAGRDNSGFIYLKQGKMRYKFLTDTPEEWEIYPGDLIFIPKGVAYDAEYLEDDTTIIIVQFDLLFGSLPRALCSHVRVPLRSAAQLINSFVEHPDPTEVGERRSLYFTSRTYELLWRAVGALDATDGRLERLAPALFDMQRNLSAQQPISYYAALCFMSETSFRRHFRTCMGTSPISYRNRLRLEEASRLIRTGEYTVAEAADATGFSNLSFFCRAYKAEFGSTPGGRSRESTDADTAEDKAE